MIKGGICMIYLDEKIMEFSKFFSEGNFVKTEEGLFFTSEEISIHNYICVELVPKEKNDWYNLKLVNVLAKNGIKENILEIMEIENTEDKELALMGFFRYISYMEEGVKISKNIIPLIKNFTDLRNYGYSEGNKLVYEFLDTFKFEGEAALGYYEGNLVLTNVALINDATGQKIKTFHNINLSSMFYIEEKDEEDIEYTIECYLESIGNVGEIFEGLI